MSHNTSTKTLNSSRNIWFGFILKIYQLLMPFVIRTIIIYILGMEYAGLNSLFTSLLSILNIAELGVGSIIVFYLYRPIINKDTEKICALIKLYKYYYRFIGLIILVVGIALSPFLKNFVNGDVPENINIRLLYFLNLSTTVASYWLFAYKNALFQAHQRNDIISKITLVTDTIKYFLQIFLLFYFKNFYLYVMAILFCQILNNILIAIIADKKYSNYQPYGSLSKRESKKINRSILDVFYGHIGMKVTLSSDSIVISSFLGLISLAQYQNYYFVVNALISFYTIFYQSLRSSIGTNLIVKSKDENYKDFKFITFIITGSLAFCSSCLINMIQSFIQLWVGPKNKLHFKVVILLTIYLLVYEITMLLGCYKDISGKWHEDRFRPLLTAIVNIISNIILVQFIGIYGILLSTIGSFILINIPWLYHRVFIDVFALNRKKDYLLYLLKKILEIITICIISYILCDIIKLDSLIFTLIVNLFICSVTSISLFYLFNKHDIEFERLTQLITTWITRRSK